MSIGGSSLNINPIWLPRTTTIIFLILIIMCTKEEILVLDMSLMLVFHKLPCIDFLSW